jgi:hypothetical protein
MACSPYQSPENEPLQNALKCPPLKISKRRTSVRIILTSPESPPLRSRKPELASTIPVLAIARDMDCKSDNSRNATGLQHGMPCTVRVLVQ